LLPGINDHPDDAKRLRRMLEGQPARVNLLRWNPVDGARLDRTRARSLAIFQRELERGGVPVVVRDTQGNDKDAACGQLWLRDASGRRIAR
jgi:23S rRNA (adenine2503-C2)-methyltransferase